MIDEEGARAAVAPPHVLADAVRPASTPGRHPTGSSLHVAEPQHRADSVTTIRTGSIDSGRLAGDLPRQLGVTLGVGLGDLAGRAFRIGHMGHVSAASVLGVLGVVESALPGNGCPNRRVGRCKRSGSHRPGVAAVNGSGARLQVVEPHSDLGSVAQPELGEDVLHMVLRGSLRDEQRGLRSVGW